MEIREGVVLAPFTTFGIGGRATYFAEVTSLAELYDALDFSKKKGLKIFILGGGSNVLLPDKGFYGLVIKIHILGIERAEEGGTVLVVAGAGEPWDMFVQKATAHHLWGIENLSGIPGTIGGAAVQNIGAYGAALSQTLEWVEVLDTVENKTKTFTSSDCRFGYRDSIFKQVPGRYVVLHVALRLSKQERPNLEYKDLGERFAGSTPALQEIREAVLAIRKNKFPDVTLEGTAGSFFKNPIVSEAELKTLQEKYPELPVFSLPETKGTKIPLGWILDHALGLRGFADGPVRLYENQALVVVAQKGSTAKEVRDFVSAIQKKVFDVCKIHIEPEVHIVAE